jgi:hypothetical protein
MIIIKDNPIQLVEMAKLDVVKVPKKIADRVRKYIIDFWWFDRKEINDLYKVGFRFCLVTNLKPVQEITFDFGFLRSYTNLHQGKSTGTETNINYEFRAIHVISTILGTEGQWYQDNFKDTDFNDVIQYQDKINLNVLSVKPKEMVTKIVRDLKLKPASGRDINILSILDRLLK